MSGSFHVAVLAFPFGTHAAPMLNLVQRLAASVPGNVVFSFFSTAESNRSIFSGGGFQNIRAFDVWDGVPEGHVFSGPHHFEQPVGLFISATPSNFEKVMKEAEEEIGAEISCLLTDAFLWFACDLAEKLGVPWIPYWTAASCSLSAHFYTDDIRRLSSTTEKTLTNIPGLEGMSISDMPREVLLANEESPLALMLYNMAMKLPRAAAVALNSFEEIDPAITDDLKSKFRNFLSVGPLPLFSSPSKASKSAENDDCLEWLEKHNSASVVYISFGTVITPPPEELVALVEALETCEAPFLWSLRDHARKNLPAQLVNRASKYGKFVSWAPQVRVLESGKVGIFVTHCGWNSILESISCGVPLICRPFFGDQRMNSGMVEDKWRIGLRMKNGAFTKSETVNAIQLILSSHKGKEIKENVQVLKVKAIDAVKPNGSSTRNFQELLKVVTNKY